MQPDIRKLCRAKRQQGGGAMIPTRKEWKALVAVYGYARAVELVNCDLDDIPGIEETWLENLERLGPEFEKNIREYLEWLRTKQPE